MTRKSNRAFTLVELIIVIAVIGVLAAILIPVFSNVVDKSNIASKTALARNLNTMIAEARNADASVPTMGEALHIAHRNGFTDEQIFNTETAGTIVFNNTKGNFAVATDVDENGMATLAYADGGQTSAPAAQFVAPVDVNEIPAVADQQFSMYLTDRTNNPVSYTVDTCVGVDVGDVMVDTINFTSNEAVDVSFRTIGGTLNVDAPNATVRHYGYADVVNISAVANQSYHEFGIVGIINIEAGHLVIEAGASVLQGVRVIDASAVTVTLFAQAAFVGNENELQGIISNDSNASVEWVATMPETIGFAGGSGTKADPYIIATAKQFANISDTYVDPWNDEGIDTKYVYFKVMDGVNKINLTSAGLVNIIGEFDGNGCEFTGISKCTMFNYAGDPLGEPTVIKNFSFTANLAKGYHMGALIYNGDGDLIIENVHAHGYVEANVPASFIAYGNGGAFNTSWEVTFRNCTSDMTLVATGENAGGFIAHQYTQKGGTLTFENSEFTGKMAVTGTKQYRYFTGMQYATANIVVKNSKEIACTGEYGTVGTHNLTTVTNAYYTAAANCTKITKGTISDPGKYNAFTVAALQGATTAKVEFMVGPNDTNETGNYTGIFMKEDLAVNGGSFTTDKIKYFDVTVNGTATDRTGISEDGHTFNVVSSNYGHTWGSANVKIKMYNANGSIVGVYVFNYPAA